MKNNDHEVTDLVFKVLNKAYGVGSGILMSEIARACDTAVETGITAFDYGLLGIGGIPCGQFTQIYGKEKTGKTTLLLHIMAGMQRVGRTCLVIDQKGAIALDIPRAERIGVDPNNAVVIPVETTEDALEKAQLLISKLSDAGKKYAFFWDDLGLASTDSALGIVRGKKISKEDESKQGKTKPKKETPAEKARAVWDFCQVLSGVCYKCNVPMVIVNQLIAVIGGSFKGFGAPKMITSGGGGIRFASRIFVNLAKGEFIKKGTEVIGHKIYAQTDSNSFFAPHRKVELHLDYRNGILSRESTKMNAGKLLKKERNGAGYICEEAGVTEYKPFEEWAKGELWALERALWPWISDPQGFDWSGLASHGEANSEEGTDDETIEEFFG